MQFQQISLFCGCVSRNKKKKDFVEVLNLMKYLNSCIFLPCAQYTLQHDLCCTHARYQQCAVPNIRLRWLPGVSFSAHGNSLCFSCQAISRGVKSSVSLSLSHSRAYTQDHWVDIFIIFPTSFHFPAVALMVNSPGARLGFVLSYCNPCLLSLLSHHEGPCIQQTRIQFCGKGFF